MAGGGALLLLAVVVSMLTDPGPARPTRVDPVFRTAGPQATTPPAGFENLDLSPEMGLSNVWRFPGGVLVGPPPRGDAAYTALKELGVRALIAVDAGPPDGEAASQHSLRFVHAPIGFDGIADSQRRVLLKAVHSLPHSIYIHSRHGLDRAAAAAAFSLVGLGRMTTQVALECLQRCGVQAEYEGLFNDVTQAKPIDPASLDGMEIEFVASAPVRNWARAMAAIGDLFDSPNSASTEQLAARFQEQVNQSLPEGKDPAMRELLVTAAKQAEDLRASWADANVGGNDPHGGARGTRGQTHRLLKQTCADCHRRFRN